MAIKAGDTFYLPVGFQGLAHLWIALTNPDKNKRFLAVNITSYDPSKDGTVILNVGDHPFIRKQSVVKYAEARLFEVTLFEKNIADGFAQRKEPCSNKLLDRLIEGLCGSDYTPGEMVKYLQERLKEGSD